MSSSGQVQQRKGHRPRGSSVSQAINEFNTYVDGNGPPKSIDGTNSENPAGQIAENLRNAVNSKEESPVKKTTKKSKPIPFHEQKSKGLLDDLRTFRWMTVPASSAKLAGLIILLWANWQVFTPNVPNPFTPLIFITHQIPIAEVIKTDPSLAANNDVIRYQKGYGDILFLLFYIIVFSFLRQSTTIYLFKPFAAWWGISNDRKRERFMEQGYSFLYWGSAGLFGIYVMSFQDSWWYQMEHLWVKYPHWMMRSELKVYYLLQFSYWMQQALVMLLRLEAPRKDYYELIAHHLVTLWLVGWSYLVNLTMIGTTVFVCMDVPDAWLAAAKGLNYLDLNTIATTTFIILMFVWTYFRIYLSAATLYSVYYQFDLIPHYAREWNPRKGWWMIWWMKYQTFAPLFLLLLLNIFWYVLMWRVMYRAVQGNVSDVREDGEYDGEGEEK
ncbi:hypothetical protein L7F22_050238 [Adiantum nelumboides]|nr:hypothetical protein [Adiantum nelumboides]